MTSEPPIPEIEFAAETPSYYVYNGREFLGSYYRVDRSEFPAFGQDGQSLGPFVKAKDAVRAIAAAAGRS